MTVINTNVKSLVAQDANRAIGLSQAISMQRLSTGLRVNSAKDDAAGLAIGTRMEAQTRGLNMAIRNANDGISLLQTAEGALQETTNSLQRMRELAVQASNGINNASDRSALDKEVQQLKEEINRIAEKTQFNNMNILDGSYKGKTIQIGDKANQVLNVSIGSAKTQDLGLGNAAGGNGVMIGARLTDADRTAAIDAKLADPISGVSLMINGKVVQPVSSFTSGTSDALDIHDVVVAINNSNVGVTASAFNEVVAKNKGTGVLSADGMEITVTALDTGKDVKLTIGSTNNMQEVVDQINAVGSESTVKARLTDDGKLALYNNSGATISVQDKTAATGKYDGNVGFNGTATDYSGMLKLESKDGSPVTIGTDLAARNGSASEADEAAILQTLGLQTTGISVTGGNAATDAYSVVGQAVSAADIVTAWQNGEMSINGVNIWRAGQETTGASYAQQGYASAAALAWAEKVDLINSFSDQTGVTAQKVQNASGQDVFMLQSINKSPISIALGDQESTVNAFGGYASHGLIEQNVGAADFDTNTPTGGSGAAGSSLSGVNMLTQESALASIQVIDNALSKVSDMRADLGAKQNRLDSTVNNLTNVVTNTEASKSRIMDTDYGKETTNLARAQIISQAATAMLAQANQSAQSVLSLLK